MFVASLKKAHLSGLVVCLLQLAPVNVPLLLDLQMLGSGRLNISVKYITVKKHTHKRCRISIFFMYGIQTKTGYGSRVSGQICSWSFLNRGLKLPRYYLIC